jgi:hypothetical protein
MAQRTERKEFLGKEKLVDEPIDLITLISLSLQVIFFYLDSTASDI